MTNVNDVLCEFLKGASSNSGFTSITYNGGKTLKFNFSKDCYTPIYINVVSNEDVTNLNILLNYLMQGAKVSSKMNEDPDVDIEYTVDMSFEDKEDDN